MKRTAYYLWESSYKSDEEYQLARQKYIDLGYRVVTFKDSQKEHDIYNGLKAIITNHMSKGEKKP